MAATKKQTKGSLTASGITYLVIGIICALVGIIVFATHAGYMLKGDCKKLEDYYNGPYPVGEYVEFDVKSALGNYAETKHTTNGIPTGTDQYFVIWTDDDSFISLKVKNKKDIETLNKISEETWASDSGYASTSFHATGKLKNISNSEIRGFYRDFFDYLTDEYGFDKSTFDIKEIELDCTDSRGSLWGMFALFLGLGVALVLMGLATLKKAKNFNNTPITDYSNSDYTPVDTTAEYNPVDTSVPYEGDSQDPNNYQ